MSRPYTGINLLCRYLGEEQGNGGQAGGDIRVYIEFIANSDPTLR
ncbi:MAG: hypothetical protein VSS75_002405 [Candidatus Parabeggiatoa sp.]|nr:hypothetical protein [Candidatus Parabeggiatoa sp.]